MKLGMNLLLWTGHVTAAMRPALLDIKRCGFDGVEVPVFEGAPDHYARLGELLDRIGLERTIVGILPSAEKNSLSADRAVRAAAIAHGKWLVDCAHALGAPIVAGPVHSAIGVFSGAGPTAQERRRAVDFHRNVGDYAARKDIRLSIEALNRFECYLLNTMAQLKDYLDEVDHPAVKAMYDTFHANIEEADPAKAMRAIKPHLIHVHLSENDRGVPGRGQVPWAETFRTLRTLRYDGWLTIEAFGRALPALAAATRVWRDFFPSKETVYQEGIRFIRKGLAAP